MKKITAIILLLTMVIMTACGAAAPAAEVPTQPQESPAPSKPVKEEPPAPPEEPEVKAEIIDISEDWMTGTETRYENGTSDYKIHAGALLISVNGHMSGCTLSVRDGIMLEYLPDINGEERCRLIIGAFDRDYYPLPLKDTEDKDFGKGYPRETVEWDTLSRTETEDAYKVYIVRSFDDVGFPNGKRAILWVEDKKTNALYQITAITCGESLTDYAKLREIVDSVDFEDFSTIVVEDCDLEAKDVVITKVAKESQEINITEWGLSNYKVSYTDPATGRLLQINANGFGSGIIPVDVEGRCKFVYTFDGINSYFLFVRMMAEKNLYSFQDASDEEIIHTWPIDGTPDMSTFERMDTADAYRIYFASDWDGLRVYKLLLHDKKSGALFSIHIVGEGLYADDARLRRMINNVEVSLAE